MLLQGCPTNSYNRIVCNIVHLKSQSTVLARKLDLAELRVWRIFESPESPTSLHSRTKFSEAKRVLRIRIPLLLALLYTKVSVCAKRRCIRKTRFISEHFNCPCQISSIHMDARKLEPKKSTFSTSTVNRKAYYKVIFLLLLIYLLFQVQHIIDSIFCFLLIA